MIALELAGRGIERDRGCRIKIVAGTTVAHPRPAVSGSDEKKIRLGIVIRRHPDGASAVLPLIAFRPGLAAGFSRSRNREGSPQFLATLGIECGDEAADTALAAGRADNDFAVGDQR